MKSTRCNICLWIKCNCQTPAISLDFLLPSEILKDELDCEDFGLGKLCEPSSKPLPIEKDIVSQPLPKMLIANKTNGKCISQFPSVSKEFIDVTKYLQRNNTEYRISPTTGTPGHVSSVFDENQPEILPSNVHSHIIPSCVSIRKPALNGRGFRNFKDWDSNPSNLYIGGIIIMFQGL